ncbi:ROK family protein [Actinoplanes utahensis]|uniref:ROK family transcriptional regulator n=1 Tax=Actinoplanes utahensis TaxID=1869 RepID=A0A0A6U8U0_ACTUT|nr:ROK family protein [Actinoplanes utahensis]KHD72475.1 ROK family transcriptional regulator [Actinoplanes utahensis]GIF29420.1 sugar kinase [Actinoplanes utahensis]
MTSAPTAVIALDVGGTGMKCALVRPDGTVHHEERHPTRADRGPEAVTEKILSVAESLAERARTDGLTPVACGIAVPGVVDEVNGVAVWSANVGFRDVPLRDLAAKRLGLPAALGHDVRVGALAEARLGAGRGRRHVLFVAIGTGIAGGLVIDGTGYPGAHGAAGELGHVVVRPDGPACGCGLRGCLEALASARAVGRRYAELSGDPRATAFDVATRAARGDDLARRVWQEAVEALADGLLTAQALYDPGVVVLGGGLAEAGDDLLLPVRAAVDARVTFHRTPEIVRAELGDAAGCLGSALLALDSLKGSS